VDRFFVKALSYFSTVQTCRAQWGMHKLYILVTHSDDLLCLQLYTIGSPYTIHASNIFCRLDFPADAHSSVSISPTLSRFSLDSPLYSDVAVTVNYYTTKSCLNRYTFILFYPNLIYFNGVIFVGVSIKLLFRVLSCGAGGLHELLLYCGSIALCYTVCGKPPFCNPMCMFIVT